MKQSVCHLRYRGGRNRFPRPVLRGVGSLLNLSGRNVWYDIYMRGSVKSDSQKDAMALREDGLAIMTELKMTW